MAIFYFLPFAKREFARVGRVSCRNSMLRIPATSENIRCMCDQAFHICSLPTDHQKFISCCYEIRWGILLEMIVVILQLISDAYIVWKPPCNPRNCVLIICKLGLSHRLAVLILKTRGRIGRGTKGIDKRVGIWSLFFWFSSSSVSFWLPLHFPFVFGQFENFLFHLFVLGSFSFFGE